MSDWLTSSDFNSFVSFAIQVFISSSEKPPDLNTSMREVALAGALAWAAEAARASGEQDNVRALKKP
jgi:hypothetical protein